MQQFFFSESRSFGTRVEQLFNFIHPASVALWNLRWQVQGFVNVAPDSTEAQLSGRFADGSGIKATNLRKICIETPWDDQLGQFAQIVGANMIALYEGWAEALMERFTGSGLVKDIQFPSRGKYGSTRRGVGGAISHIHGTGTSAQMKSAFHPVYAASKKYSINELEALMAVYRYHKEIRNSFMHNGGAASENAEKAWLQVKDLTRTHIGGKSDPILTQITEGQQIVYTIKEAIQLSDVIIRLVHTIDAELSHSSVAEKHFLESWRSTPDALRLRYLPGEKDRQEKRASQICRKVGFVKPADPAAVIKLGQGAGLLS